MSLRIRRGLSADRTSITPLEGEFIYTTDTKVVYIGDGTTAGGNALVGEGGGGGGESSNGFSGILVGSNVVVADSSTDRLIFVAGSGITIAANPTTDTITFSSTGGDGGFSNGQSISVTDFIVTGNATIPGFETRATANSRLANTNSRIALVNTNLTGTNTALTTLINARLQVSNSFSSLTVRSANTAAVTTISSDVKLNDAMVVNPAGHLQLIIDGITYKVPYFL